MCKDAGQQTLFNFKKKLQYLTPNKNLNIKKNKPNIENCTYYCIFFFLNQILKISLGFWKIVSLYVSGKIYEKLKSLPKILNYSKLFWIKKNFSFYTVPYLNYIESSLISKTIIFNLSHFLNLCGSNFFTKFSNKYQLVLGKIFNFKVSVTKFNLKLRLTESISLYSCNFYHFFKAILFFHLNNIALATTDIWLICNRFKIKKLPWWRRLKTRECELEFICKDIVFNCCTNFGRVISKINSDFLFF